MSEEAKQGKTALTPQQAAIWDAGWRAAQRAIASKIARHVYDWRILDMPEIAESWSDALAEIRAMEPPA
jgi:hypothetical protein